MSTSADDRDADCPDDPVPDYPDGLETSAPSTGARAADAPGAGAPDAGGPEALAPDAGAPVAGARLGRRPSTSLDEIERVGMALFSERGFDAVSIDEIASTVGIGRRTFFRYYPSKNDIVWGRFDELVDDWEQWMSAEMATEIAPLPLLEAIRVAVLKFNEFDDLNEMHRVRMGLILQNPALQAHATLRHERWRTAISRYAAHRLGTNSDAFIPLVIGHLALGASLAAYEQWLRTPSTDIRELLTSALSIITDHGDLIE